MQTTNMPANDSENRPESGVRFHTSNRTELEALLAQSLQHIRNLENSINALLQSRSWRLTGPLRAALDMTYSLRGLPVADGNSRTRAPESIAALLAQRDLIDAMLQQSNETRSFPTSPTSDRVDNSGKPSYTRIVNREQPKGLHSGFKSPLETWFS
jgi:hypothetical protein